MIGNSCSVRVVEVVVVVAAPAAAVVAAVVAAFAAAACSYYSVERRLNDLFKKKLNLVSQNI